ncbi:MAG TPA: hypothetical protein DEQ38_11380 [Elusimicrobia bacterium]|nr:MAG: hypothetical protein A2089_14105 [Elusimicrobia bacterium GWD2_63_28]HCC48699.1 hypothetical protein [Elusimicrobiota bacterium]
MTDNDQVTILVAEDNDGHALLIKERLEASGVTNPQLRFRDGLEAWEFLSRPGGGREPGRPYLLLLDINMPRMDGGELLKRIKEDPDLKKMPVIMLTTTDDPREIDACYELGCNNYLTKPVVFSQFFEVIKRLGLFISVISVARINGK